MPIIDKRDDSKAYFGGSSLLQVYLTEAQALAVYLAGSVAGWYTMGYLAGGQVGEEYETEQLKDEAGVIVRNKVNSDESIFENTLMQTDDATMRLVAHLADVPHKFRYLLPAEEGKHQIYGMYRGLADKNSWRVGTAEGENRQRPFIIRGSKDDAGNPKLVIATVNSISDESAWPTILDAFKTDETAWPA
jgi:hypothetical protein